MQANAAAPLASLVCQGTHPKNDCFHLLPHQRCNHVICKRLAHQDEGLDLFYSVHPLQHFSLPKPHNAEISSSDTIPPSIKFTKKTNACVNVKSGKINLSPTGDTTRQGRLGFCILHVINRSPIKHYCAPHVLGGVFSPLVYIHRFSGDLPGPHSDKQRDMGVRRAPEQGVHNDFRTAHRGLRSSRAPSDRREVPVGDDGEVV